MKINKKKAWKYGLISGLSVAAVSLITVPSLVSCSSLKNNNNNTNNASSGASGSETGQSFHNFKNSNQKVVTNGYLASGLKLVNNIAQEPEQLASLSDYYNLNPSDTPITINPETHNTSWTATEALAYTKKSLEKYSQSQYEQMIQDNIKYLYQIANDESGTFNWVEYPLIYSSSNNLNELYSHKVDSNKMGEYRIFVVSKVNNVKLNNDGKLSFDWDTSMVYQAKANNSKNVEFQAIFNNDYSYSDLSYSANLMYSNNNVSSFLTPTSYKVTNTLSTSNVINNLFLQQNLISTLTMFNKRRFNHNNLNNSFLLNTVQYTTNKSWVNAFHPEFWNNIPNDKILQTKTQNCDGKSNIDIKNVVWKTTEFGWNYLNKFFQSPLEKRNFDENYDKILNKLYVTQKINNNYFSALTESNQENNYFFSRLISNSNNIIYPYVNGNIENSVMENISPMKNNYNEYNQDFENNYKNLTSELRLLNTKNYNCILPTSWLFNIKNFNNPIVSNSLALSYNSNSGIACLANYFLPSFPIQPSGKIALNFGNIESITSLSSNFMNN